MALKADATVVEWGSKFCDSTVPPHSTPTVVAGLSGIVSIAAGDRHGLALREDGAVLVWGCGFRGRLGLGNQTDVATPVVVPGLPAVAEVAAGWSFSAVRTVDGRVFTWGASDENALGLGGGGDRWTPAQVAVSGASGLHAAFTAVVLERAVVGTSPAGPVGWGKSWLLPGLGDQASPVVLAGAAGLTDLTVGWYHVLAKDGQGRVNGWGWQAEGRLGDGVWACNCGQSNPKVLDVPETWALWAGANASFVMGRDGRVRDMGRAGPVQHRYATAVPELRDLVQAASGYSGAFNHSYSLALGADGYARSWGDGYSGQTGQGGTSALSRPTVIAGLRVAENGWNLADADGDGLSTVR